MKEILVFMRAIFFILFLGIGFNGLSQPLSGTYTIGGTSPDYPKMSDAVDALDSLGISGPVTFNIRNGTYTDYMVIDTIVGTSDTSWVTFQSESGDSSVVIIEGFTTSSPDRIIGFLSGAQFIRLKKLTFLEPNPNQRAITAFDGHHLEFYNCVFTGPSNTVHQVELLGMGVRSDLVIENCLFTGSTKDLVVGSIGRTYNVKINRCDFHGGLESLRFNDLENIEVTNNNFYGTYGGSGIRRLILLGTVRSLRFTNNFVDASWPIQRGYALEIRASAADSSYFTNNTILCNVDNSANSSAVLFGNVSGGAYLDIFAHNTIRFSSTNPSNSVFSSASCNFTGTRMYNNIIVNESGGYLYDNCSYPTDYNLLYTTGAISPSDSSLAQLQQSGLDSHSVFAPPQFDALIPGLSHAPEIDSAGFPFARFPKDYLGNFRDPNFPDIGPYEFINPPVVRFPNDTTVCESVVLDAQNPGSTYLWSTGDTTKSIVADSAATYWVTATNSKGSNSDTIQVFIDSLNLPNYQLQTSFDSLCLGGCVDLSTNLDSNLYQLVWGDTSGIIGTGSHISDCPAGLPKTYYLEISEGGVCSAMDSITVLEKTVSPTAIANADTTICEGDSLLLSTVSNDSIENVTWQSKGQVIGSGSVWVTPDSLTTYSAMVDFANGCSDSVSVEVDIHYVTEPIVALSFDTLSVADDWNSYQWKVNGSVISSANDTFWVAQQNGNYSVVVTDSTGCAKESLPVLFSRFSLTELRGHFVKLYPNPVKQMLTIELDPLVSNPHFEVYNLVGEHLNSEVLSSGKNQYKLNVEQFTAGIYLLRIYSDGGAMVQKFVRE